jgi:hypothetical protein
LAGQTTFAYGDCFFEQFLVDVDSTNFAEGSDGLPLAILENIKSIKPRFSFSVLVFAYAFQGLSPLDKFA